VNAGEKSEVQVVSSSILQDSLVSGSFRLPLEVPIVPQVAAI
jgi:hypothetical protein